jgi:hypothetical protein
MGLALAGTAIVLGACSDRGNNREENQAALNGVAASTTVAGAGTAVAAMDTIDVWKDPNCGCCKNWVEHMRKHGFAVVIHDTPDMTPIKQARGVGADVASCHTAVVGDYTIEGHVPADLVRRLLTEKPRIAGLAVPGMPMGSPGMEGGMKERYDVIAFGTDGSRSVYATR